MEALLENDQVRDTVVDLLTEHVEILETNQLQAYSPYDYQRKFHAGKDGEGNLARQRMLMAGNKTGKTYCGAMELSYHLTGLYPEWWLVLKFDKPIKAWAAGNTSNNTRDIVQSELLGEPGDPEEFGKGAIPKHLIVSTERQPGVPNAIAQVVV